MIYLSERLNCIKVFINNTAVIGWNLSFEENLKEHNKVLIRIEEAGLYLSISKTKWAVSRIKYLRLIVTKNRYKLDLKKIEAILNTKLSKKGSKIISQWYEFLPQNTVDKG